MGDTSDADSAVSPCWHHSVVHPLQLTIYPSWSIFQRQYCHFLQDSSVVHLLQLTINPSWSIFWRQYCQHIQGHTVLYLLQLTIYPSWSTFFGDNIVNVIVKSFKVCRPHPWDPNYSPWEQIVSTVPYAVLREYPQIITMTQIQVTE